VDWEAGRPDVVWRSYPNQMVSGSVHTQYVRCGKVGCRCARENGGHLHGPYYYRFVRYEGQQVKQYIQRKDVEPVRLACEDYRQLQAYLLWNRRRTARLYRYIHQYMRWLRTVPDEYYHIAAPTSFLRENMDRRDHVEPERQEG